MASPGAAGCGDHASASSANGSAAAMDDERRRKRRLSNRESARRTRARRQQQFDGLEAEAEALRGRKSRLDAAARAVGRGLAAVEADNAVLRARALELGARLRSLAELLLYCRVDGPGFFSASACGGAQMMQPLPFAEPAADMMMMYANDCYGCHIFH